MKLSAELLNELKAKQEAIVGETMPALQSKDYLQQMVDPAMLPIIAASFMQNLNNAIEAGSLDVFKTTVEWLFQMAEAKQLVEPLEKFMDFFTTIEETAKKNIGEEYHAEFDSFVAEVKQVFVTVAQSRNA